MPDFIADENIDFRIIDELRKSGINILSVYESYRGLRDSDIVQLAKKNKAIIITEDKDFGEWAFSHKKINIGVILLRYKSGEEVFVVNALKKIILDMNQNIIGKFVVLTKKKVRIRDI